MHVERAHDLNEATIESLEASERGKHLREAQFLTHYVWQRDWLVQRSKHSPLSMELTIVKYSPLLGFAVVSFCSHYISIAAPSLKHITQRPTTNL